MAIEVEIRSFISKEKYEELLEFFKKEGEFLNEDVQETHYFDCEEDLRIQKNNFFSKIWMKKGKMHDERREELEIKFGKDNFDKLKEIFTSLGYKTTVKWFRNRHEFKWQGISVMLDYNKGYGHILELEKMSDEGDKDMNLEILKQKLKALGVPLTPREEFDKKLDHYSKNWKNLT